MLRRITLGIVATLLAGASAPVAMATSYPHAACEAIGGTPPLTAIQYLRNDSDGYAVVACPIVKDSVRTGISSASIYSEGGVSCLLIGQKGGGASGKTARGRTWFSGLPIAHSNNHDAYYLQCILPPGSRFYSYRIDE